MISPLISVVIPAYNAADTIMNCIDSVLQQTVSLYEIIVVNDGSVDNTESIVCEFKERRNQQNLLIFSQPNGGVAKARNRGIMEAKGDWIAFLDADDRWLPEKTAKQIEILRRYPDISIIGTYFFPTISEQKAVCFDKVSFIGMLFKNMLFTSTVIVRKNVVMQYYFDEDKKYSEDSKLWFQIIHSHKGIVLRDGLVVYAENQKKYKRKSLSNDLWKMERNELDNYFFLYKKQTISIFLLIVLILFSLLKFIKRYLQSFF